MVTQTETQGDKAARTAGKYLTFNLGGEPYGLPILKVREIIARMDITSVPGTPGFISGVINLRGRVIPVMDLRRRFGLPAAESSAAGCIVVAYVGEIEMGLVVDSVSEVLDMAADDIAETPSFGPHVNTDFITGIGKTAGQVTILLDLDKVLTQSEVEAVATTSANN